jgi:Pyridoxamine 5'-phosphate oxidase
VVTANKQGEADAGGARAGTGREAGADRLTSEQVWRAIAGASFAVVSYVTPGGEPRSSGVVYATAGRRLYAAVAPDSWKARHIAASGQVSVTVPVRRGGLLSLLLPIPPATVSCHGTAIVHPAGPVGASEAPDELAALLPAVRRASCCVLEIIPEGQFLTYGLGVSLTRMRSPADARARVPVGTAARRR